MANGSKPAWVVSDRKISGMTDAVPYDVSNRETAPGRRVVTNRRLGRCRSSRRRAQLPSCRVKPIAFQVGTSVRTRSLAVGSGEEAAAFEYHEFDSITVPEMSARTAGLSDAGLK